MTDAASDCPSLTLLRQALTADLDLALECGVEEERLEELLGLATVLSSQQRRLCESWAAEYRQTLLELGALKRALGPVTWAKMPQMKALGLREGKKRERLEDRPRRLLHQELPGVLQVG